MRLSSNHAGACTLRAALLKRVFRGNGGVIEHTRHDQAASM